MRRSILIRAVLSASVAICAPAFAQQGQGNAEDQSDNSGEADLGGVPDIVVTAQRREERLQDVPISITALGADQLEQRGIEGLDDLQTGSVPGLVIYRGNGLATQISANIRGVTVADPAQGTAEQGVAVYIDGVYLGRSQGLGMDLIDAERIEVLRGPQGTLFGRNAEGGAIQVVSRPPSGQFEVHAGVTYGNYNYNRQFAHVNLPEVGGFRVKFDVYHSGHDGFVENVPAQASLNFQHDFLEEDGVGLRGAVRWRPLDGLTVDYAYDWSRTRYSTSYYALFDRTGVSATGRPLDTGRPDRTWTALYSPLLETEAEGHSLIVNYSVSNAITLRSITAFRSVDDGGLSQTAGANSFLAIAGVPVSGVPAARVYGRTGLVAGANLSQSQESQELQLIGTFPRLDLTMGLYHYHEEASDERFSGATIFYTAPGPSAPISINPIITAQPNFQSSETTLYAAYAQATWTPPILADRLELTAGIRYSNDEKVAQRTIQNGVLLAAPIVAQPFQTQRWDPAFTIKFNFNPDVNIYLRYAQAYRAGGVSVRSPTFLSYGAETARQWELGFKSRFFDRRLLFNLSLFENRIEDLQINTFIDPTNASRLDTINIPTTFRVRGLESEIILVPTSGLTFTLNYSYEDQNNPNYTLGNIAVNLLTPVVPRHAAYFGVDATVGQFAIGRLRLHADYAVSSGFYRPGLINATTLRALFLSRTDTVNARVTLDRIAVAGGHVEIALWARNLLDTEYIAFSSNGGGAIFGDPRTFGVDLNIRF